ncbi:MAG: DegV family protein [Chloroflexi bacterium]|nr:DegV family protein [Chloroflexota bacterium]
MAVKIVTDSTADLPSDVAHQLGITVVPLNVHFGDETFRDGVDLDAGEFFRRLPKAPRVPTTSQPSPGAFLEVYRPLLEAGHQVVSIHISSKLSGTVNSALQARAHLEGASVEVVDSLQVTASLALVVVAAARAVQAGASYQEAIGAAHRARERVHLLAYLDTLEYLKKGGRIGKVQAVVGTLLRVRPVVTVHEGIVHSATKVRSRAQGIEYMVSVARDRAPLEQAMVIYSTEPDDARALAERLGSLVEGGNVIVGRVGPVLGTYTGPGAFGIAVQARG